MKDRHRILFAVLLTLHASIALAETGAEEALFPVCRVHEGETETEKVVATAVHDGETYGFCSADCRDTFLEAPTAYLPPVFPRPAPPFVVELAPFAYAFPVDAAIKARKRKPMFAVDIAVPRDIEASAGDLDDFYLYSIDDLDKVILEGQGNREAAAVEAHRLLDDEIRRYAAIERSKQVAPVISTLRETNEVVRKQVAEQARRRMARGESPEDAIEFATASLMKKMLHKPSVELRKAGESSDAELIAAARKLFGLDED